MGSSISKDILAQVLVLDETGEMFVDIVRIDHLVLVFELAARKADIFKQFLDQCMQTAGTNIFGCAVHLGGHVRKPVDSVIGKTQLYTLCSKKCLVLLNE